MLALGMLYQRLQDVLLFTDNPNQKSLSYLDLKDRTKPLSMLTVFMSKLIENQTYL